jgi:putative DNA methylase
MLTRRDFANSLRQELPEAIKHLQSGNVAPVDLAQASIGPGMAVFSRYRQVVNADGSPMSVREALQMINQVLDEALHEQEADFDAETRFAVRWFEQYGMTDGPFGDAETLAKAMAVAVSGVVEAGLLASKAGKVRLLKREELEPNWNPATDKRSTIWECTQHLIRRLEAEGESGAAQLLADIQQAKGSEAGEVARELSYRLYSTCERKDWATEARSYNGLVVSWPEIVKLARGLKDRAAQPQQQEMF